MVPITFLTIVGYSSFQSQCWPGQDHVLRFLFRFISGSCLVAHGIPTGFRPTAQGCGNAATLGTTPPPPKPNPNGVASFSRQLPTPGKTAAAEKSSVICPDAHLGDIFSSIGSATPFGVDDVAYSIPPG